MNFSLASGNTTLPLSPFIEITDTIRRHLDQGNYVLGLFVDLTKAFDTVDHEILLYKLNHYGIRGHANRFFRSYLSNRKQYTFVNGEHSSIMTVECGVPQGSVLGPILFLLYINDLCQAVGPEIARLFADDTGLFTSNSNFQNLISESKEIYRKLFKWCLSNKLTINDSKTCFILFHTKNKPVPKDFSAIQIDDIIIKRVDNTKYLGLFIDEKLNWTNHVHFVCRSLTKYFGIFNKIKSLVTRPLARQLYFSFVYSRIQYGLEIYGTCSAGLLSKLQTLQNGLLKLLLCRNYRESTNVIHSELKILKVKEIRIVNLANFVNNCLLGNLPAPFNLYFQYRNSMYGFRNQNLNVPWARTTCGSLRTQVSGAKLWNGLLNHDVCRSFVLKKSFKKSLVKHYLVAYVDM